jgi:hypothetical protein
VLLVALFAALSFGPATGGLAADNAARLDDARLTHAFADPLFVPLARWDAVWYLRVADSGYGESKERAAFFPLYPLLVRAVATPFGATPAALLTAAYVIALAAFFGALALLYRLVSLELGRPLAQPAMLLLAVFPAAFYFGAPYAESLFLLLAIGAFYAARTDRWAWVAISLLVPLSEPVEPQPLMSLPRFVAVLFPVFMWLAAWSEERRATDRVVAVSSIGLGLFTAWFASWHWIA